LCSFFRVAGLGCAELLEPLVADLRHVVVTQAAEERLVRVDRFGRLWILYDDRVVDAVEDLFVLSLTALALGNVPGQREVPLFAPDLCRSPPYAEPPDLTVARANSSLGLFRFARLDDLPDHLPGKLQGEALIRRAQSLYPHLENLLAAVAKEVTEAVVHLDNLACCRVVDRDPASDLVEDLFVLPFATLSLGDVPHARQHPLLAVEFDECQMDLDWVRVAVLVLFAPLEQVFPLVARTLDPLARP